MIISPAQTGEVKIQRGSENICQRNIRKPSKNIINFDEKKISNRLKIASPSVVLKTTGTNKSKTKAATLGWKSCKNDTNFSCSASYSYRILQINAFAH